MGWFDVLAPIVGQVGGAVVGGIFNQQAADKAAKAAGKSTAAYREDAAKARDIYGNIMGETAAGPSYLRRVITGSTALTPTQQAERDELRRSTLNTLSAGGLRGSGRAVTAAIRDTESDFTNRALDTNQRRADQAANAFASPYFNAAGDAARSHIGEGAFAGQNIYDAGMGQAQAGLATGQLYASTLGGIAADLRPRESAYSEGGTVKPSPGATMGDVGALIAAENKRRASGLRRVA